MPLRKMTGRNSSIKFIEAIINSMNDWVRVIDKNDNVIFINKAMSSGLKNLTKGVEEIPVGMKCYETIGKSEPCENCTSRKTVFDGISHVKEEHIADRVFSVMSSPVSDEEGEIIAVVEVLRDVTKMKQLQHKIVEQNTRLQNDLSLAKKLQSSLLPRQFPEGKVDFSFIYKPCESLGGDFIDIFNIDQTHIGVYIADVSGHGVSASMLTVFLRSTINKKTLSPAAALDGLYNEFNQYYSDQDMYITLFYAIIDTAAKTLVYSNAGHNVSPVLYSSDRLEFLRTPGIPISNWAESTGYHDNFRKLFSGDRIFLYTDGIIEIRNEQNEQFGEERLLAALLGNDEAPSAVLDNIIDSAGSFCACQNPSDICDDITIALLQIK